MTAQRDPAAEALDFVFRQDPDLAVELGRLPPVLWEDLSPAARDAACAQADALLAEIGSAPGDPALNVARYHVACTRSLVAHRDVGSLNHMTGPLARLSWAVDGWPIGLDPDAAIYVERLRAFPAFCAEMVRAASGWTEPASRPVLESFVIQADSMLRDHATGTGPVLQPLEVAGVGAAPGLLDDVLSGVAVLRDLALAAMPTARTGSALVGRADGLDRYAEAVFRGCSIRYPPDELEALGRATLQRSQARFDQLAGSDEVTFQPIVSGAEYLAAMEQAHARLTLAYPAVCKAVPVMPCEVVPMPGAHAAVGPPAYYGPSSRRNNRPGLLYVNTAEPVTTRIWDVLPLAMHEGVPGHHLQLALLDENEAIPEVMRALAVNAFTEGWAVYAETLAPAMGLDVSPVEEFGLLAHQRWRAARLITDVGLHVRGWTVDEAVRFMSAQTLMDPRTLRREVVRYLGWPGQALGYAAGAHVITEWVNRRGATESLADAHSTLLSIGSVPLEALHDGTA